MNRFEMIGRITKEPETRYTSEGKGITTFTLAVNNTKEDVTFVKITTFNSTGELIQKYCHKGDLILVDGIIKNNNYEDKEGKKHFEYVFIGNRVEFLNRTTNDTKKEENAKKEPKNELSDEAFAEFGKKIEQEIAF